MSNSTNIIKGTTMGVGTAVAGVGTGIAAGVALPVLGAKKGVGGFLAGTAAGGLAMGVAAIGGVAMGTNMIVSGVLGTPASVMAFAKDDDLHGGERIDLSKVEAKVPTMGEREDVGGPRPSSDDFEYKPTRNVKDRKYYDLLGVQPDATPSQLKKAYYNLARTEHPDRGGDKERFQQIGEAYSVLSNSVTRKKYDQLGASALKEGERGDPGAVFGMMFGEGRFAPYIGEMTSVIKMRLDDSMSDPLKQVTELQRLTKERDASCAKLLALRLEGALVTPEPWTARMVREIIRLYQTNLGPQLCKAVGKMYQLRAESALGFKARLNQLGFGGGDDAVQFVSGAAKAIGAAAEMQKMAADGSPEANSREKVEAQMFDMMALDIEGTISNAASLCLHDTSIDKPARRNRAKALQKLGVLFSSIAEALDAQSAQRLRISGLKSRPEVNGCYGLVEGINSSTGRVNVKLERTSEVLALKKENLEGFVNVDEEIEQIRRKVIEL